MALLKGIYYIHQDIRNLLNQNSRYEEPEVIDQYVWQAVRQYIGQLIGLKPEEYAPSRPIPIRYGFGHNRQQLELIAPITTELAFSKTPGSGEIAISETGVCVMPDNILFIATIINYPTPYTTSPCNFVQDNQLSFLLSSKLTPINNQNPRYQIVANGFKLYPSSLTKVIAKVVAMPTTAPLYAYSYDETGNGAPVYNNSASIDVPFGPQTWVPITLLAARAMSIPVENVTLLQATANVA